MWHVIKSTPAIEISCSVSYAYFSLTADTYPVFHNQVRAAGTIIYNGRNLDELTANCHYYYNWLMAEYLQFQCYNANQNFDCTYAYKQMECSELIVLYLRYYLNLDPQ